MRDDNSQTPIRIKLPGEEIKDSSIIMNIDFEYTERIYNIHFYGVMDILQQLGGLRALFLSIFGILAPLFVTNFL